MTVDPHASTVDGTLVAGDLREQFVWGRFEYMQTGDTRLMREVLDMAITDAGDPLPVGPIIEHGVDLRVIAAATLGHPRPPHVMVEAAPSPGGPGSAVVPEPDRAHQPGRGVGF